MLHTQRLTAETEDWWRSHGADGASRLLEVLAHPKSSSLQRWHALSLVTDARLRKVVGEAAYFSALAGSLIAAEPKLALYVGEMALLFIEAEGEFSPVHAEGARRVVVEASARCTREGAERLLERLDHFDSRSRIDELWRRAVRSDIGLRVLGDALLELGDPRGSFILMSLSDSHAAQEQAAALLEKHRYHWLGPWSHVVEPGTDVWRDGLLRGFRAGFGTWPERWIRSFAALEWIDVSSVDLARAESIVFDSRVPLQEIRGARMGPVLERLLFDESPRKRLERLVLLDGKPFPRRVLRLIIDTLDLPAGYASQIPWETFLRRPPRRTCFRMPESDVGSRAQSRATALVVVAGDGAVRGRVWLLGGEPVVDWHVLEQLRRLGARLDVVGEPGAGVTARLRGLGVSRVVDEEAESSDG